MPARARIRRIVPAPTRVAQTEELTLNAAVAPTGILPSQPHDQHFHLFADRRTTGPVRISPMPLNQSAMPRQQGAWGNEAVLTHPVHAENVIRTGQGQFRES